MQLCACCDRRNHPSAWPPSASCSDAAVIDPLHLSLSPHLSACCDPPTSASFFRVSAIRACTSRTYIDRTPAASAVLNLCKTHNAQSYPGEPITTLDRSLTKQGPDYSARYGIGCSRLAPQECVPGSSWAPLLRHQFTFLARSLDFLALISLAI